VAAHVLDRTGQARTHRAGSVFERLRHLDVLLLATTFVLTAIGLVLVYSASRAYALSIGVGPYYFVERQVIYVALGLVVMVIFSVIDYRRIEEWGYWIYGLSILGLIAVISPIGQSSGGATRWISLGPIQLQPSEFAVIGLICAIACYVSRRESELGFRELGVILALAALPMLLVVKQPDLGTGIVMCIVLAALLVIGGVRMRYLLALLSVVIVAFVALGELHLLNGYQISRLTCFLHQDSQASSFQTCNYNLIQAKTAIGSGGIRGTGLLNGQVTNLGYVPVAYADFIFSALGEQLGFLGGIGLIAVFCVLLARVVRGIQLARDMLGRLLCAGILAFIAFSVFQNVGMNIGIMPITGIPLPFISYGGSALLAFYAGIGLVSNVELRRGTRR
jgi:rod shape determining protein RodA